MFRIDDVCLNTDPDKLTGIVERLLKFGDVMMAVSPICYLDPQRPEYIYPPQMACSSDPLKLCAGNRIGVPSVVNDLRPLPGVSVASHGLVHVDHRLLSHDAQRLSILQSCAIIDTDTFVPPWHKWNKDTESICDIAGITLIKWEPGVHLHAGFNLFSPDRQRTYYLHSFDVPTVGAIDRWLAGGTLT